MTVDIFLFLHKILLKLNSKLKFTITIIGFSIQLFKNRYPDVKQFGAVGKVITNMLNKLQTFTYMEYFIGISHNDILLSTLFV